MKWNGSRTEDEYEVNYGYHEPPEEGAWHIRMRFEEGVPEHYDDFCRHISMDLFDKVGNYARVLNSMYEIWWRSHDDCKRSWCHAIQDRWFESYKVMR